MNLRRVFNLAFVLLLVLSLLPSLAHAAPQGQAPGIDKIDKELLDRLAVNGQVDFYAILTLQADLSGAAELSGKVAKTTYVFNALRDTARETQAPLLDYLDKQGLTYFPYYIQSMIHVQGAGQAAVEWFAARPDVARVSVPPEPQLEPVMRGGTQPEKTEAVEWNITRVGAPDVWAMGYHGEGMVVAGNDTGVSYTHPALVNQYRGNLGGGTFDHNYNWWGGAGSLAPSDSDGHGTHTMGTMVGDDGGTNQVGMAPGAEWIACAGLGSSEPLECFEFFLTPWDLNHLNPDPTKAPDAINNSWYDPSGFDYRPIIQSLNAAGIAVIKSAGNTGPSCSTISNPGQVPEIIATAAFAQGDTIASFSSRGPSSQYGPTILKPEVAAPGVNVRSSVPGGGYDGTYSGTSMAAPHSTGLVALIWSAAPCIQGDVPLTKQIMMETAEAKIDAQCPPFIDHPNDVWGWGILDAELAVQTAMGYCGESGYLNGHVTEAGTGTALEGITVTADKVGGGGDDTLTDATGYYSMTLFAGTYTVTAEGPEHTAAVVTGVNVVTGTITTLDLQLQPRGHLYGYVTDAASGIPLAATVTADGESAATDPATGYYELYLDAGSYDVTAEATDYASQTVAINLSAGQELQQDFALVAAVSVVPEPIHAYVVLGQTGTLPAQMTNNMIAPYPFEFIEIEGATGVLGSGGPDPFGYVYADSNEPGGPRYEWIDATDGTALGLTDDGEGNVTLPFAFSFYGTSSTAIRVANNGGFLFNVTTGDLSTANADLGTTTASNLVVPFWDDIDADTGDVYYKTVGTEPNRIFVVEWYNRPHFSNVGNATFELLLYESTNNIKYQYQDVVFGNALYDYGISATAGIRQTGTNYLQYSYNQAVLADGLSICFQYPGSPPCDGGDIPWYATDIVSGTVPGGGTLGWTNLFSATADVGITQPGEYEGTLRVQPEVAGHPVKNVPVIMTVLPTATLGRLQGTVTSDRPGGPLEAAVNIQGTGGYSVTLSTDPATGAYGLWIEAGAYDVEASATGYVSESVGVQVVATQTTTQDFELALLAPEVVVDPLALAQTLDLGATAQQTLNIGNVGLTALNWELRERPVNNVVLANTILLMVEDVDATGWAAYRTALDEGGYTWDEWDLDVLAFPTAADLAPYETLIWADESSMTPGDADCQVVVDWLVSGGKSLFVTSVDFIWDLQNGTVGAGEHNLYLLLNTTYVGDYAGTTIATLDGVAGDPIGGDFVSPNGLALAGTADNNGDYASTSSVATTGLIYGTGGTGSGYAGLSHYEDATYKTVWLGVNFHNGLADADQRNLLMANIMGMLAGGDVPWLMEEPVTGTLEPGGAVDVAVTFDAGAVPEPGVYLAELRVSSDDPYNGQVSVPVTMTVLATGDLGKLEGEITGLGYCDGESYPLEATVVIEASGGLSWTVTSDPAGYYYRWLDAGTYTVTASAPEHVAGTAVVQITGLQTTTQDLALRYIESCMSVVPTSYSLTLLVDTQYVDTLAIGNAGAGELLWEVHETTRTIGVAIPAPAEPVAATPVGPVERPVITSPDQCAQYENYTGVEPIGAAEFCGTPGLATLPSGGILAPTDPGYAVEMYNTDTLVTFPLNNFTGQTTVGPVSEPYYGVDFEPSGTVLYGLSDTTDQLGTFDLTTGAFTGLVPCAPGGGAANWTGLSIDPSTGVFYGSTATSLFIIDPATGNSTLVGAFGTTLMIDIAVNAEGQMYGHDIGTDSIYSIDKTTGTATLIGPTGYAANYAQGMDFDNDDGTLYIWLYQGGGANVYGTVDLVTGAVTPLTSAPQGEFEGATQTVGMPPWNDVPWVSEVPTNGIVGPDNVFEVDVVFDSTGLTVGECYTASLGLVHDDPGWESPYYIPLLLCVEEAPQCEPITGIELSVSANPPVYPGELVTVTVDVMPDGATVPYSYTVNGGAVQTTTDDPFSFSLSFSEAGTQTVEVEVWNCAGMVPVTGTIEVVVTEPEPEPFYFYLPIVLKVYGADS